MQSRTAVVAVLCCLSIAPALAHESLPNEWRREPTALLISIGDFELDGDRLAAALIEEMSLPPVNCMSGPLQDARSHNGTTGTPTSTSYWSFEPFSRCGGVERHYEAATQLARTVCAEMSTAQRISPPAVPVVALPHTYLDARDHHAGGYHITDGPLIGTCVIRATP